MEPTTDTVFNLYHSGAFLCAGILLGYLSLRYLSTHVAWLQVPGRAHYVAAVLGGLATIIVPVSQGTTPNMSMITLVVTTIAALFLRGAVRP